MISCRCESVSPRRLGCHLLFAVVVYVVVQGASLLAQDIPGDSIEGWTQDQVRESLGRPSIRDRQPDETVVWYYDGTSKGTVRVYFANGEVVNVRPEGLVRELLSKEVARRSAEEANEPEGAGIDLILPVDTSAGSAEEANEPEGAGIDLILLMDTSSGIDDQFRNIQQIAITLLGQLSPDDRVQLVDFDSRVDIVEPLTSDHARVEEAIGKMSTGGATVLYDALYISLKELEQAPVVTEDVRRTAIVVLSDGADTHSVIEFDEVLDLARQAEVPIYSIAVQLRNRRSRPGSREATAVLQRLADETGAQAFFPRGRGNDLEEAAVQFAESLSSLRGTGADDQTSLENRGLEADTQAVGTERAFNPGPGIENPQVVRQVKPNYTPEAMRAKVEGTVWLEAVVLTNGTVGDVWVTKSLDTVFGLDKEAVRAVKQWRFQPGTRFGEPVAVIVGIEMSFSTRLGSDLRR